MTRVAVRMGIVFTIFSASWLVPSGYASTTQRRSTSPLWARTYDGREHVNDSPYKLHVSPDGDTVYEAAATNAGASSFSGLILAYSAATGKVLWKAIQGRDRGTVFFDVAVDPTGSRVFGIGAYYATSTEPREFIIRAFDAVSGSTEWTARSPVGGALSAVVASDGSRLYVEGTQLVGSSFASVTVAYDASSGARVWASRYTDPKRSGFANATPLRLSSDNARLFFAGQGNFTSNSPDITVLAYATSDGHRLWARRYASNGSDGTSDAALSPDDSTFVVAGGTAAKGPTLLAYDADTGHRRWVSHEGPSDAVTMSPDSTTLYTTGSEPAVGHLQMVTVAHSLASGAQLWQNTYADPNATNTEAHRIAASPDGTTVVVSGTSEVYPRYAIVTHAIAALDGSDRWSAAFDNPDMLASDCDAVAIDPQSTRAFVTGDQETSTDGIDIITIAYNL